MNVFWNMLSKIALKTALSGVNSASGWNLYQPTLPAKLRH